MAPKSKKLPSAAGSACSAKSKGVKKDLRLKPHNKAPFGHCSAVTCSTCSQNTHQYDRDYPQFKKQFLKWHKKHWSNGVYVPSQKECYVCFDIRRRFFGQFTQKELDEKLDESSGLRDQHSDYRLDKCLGTKRYRHAEPCDVWFFIVKDKHAAYKQRYREGTFTSIWSFATERNIDVSHLNKDQLAQLIVKQYNKTVMIDEDGTLGIECDDQIDGKYRYKRGVETKLEKYISYQHGDDDSAEMQIEYLKGDTDNAFDLMAGRGSEPAASSDITAEQPIRDCLMDYQGVHGGRAEKSQGMGFFKNDMKAPLTTPTRVPASTIGGMTDVTSSASGVTRNGSKAGSTAEVFGDDNQDPPEDTTFTIMKGNAKKRQPAKVIEDARAQLELMPASLSALWTTGKRKKDIDKCCRRLRKFGRVLSEIVGDETATTLSQTMFDRAGDIDNIQKLIAIIKCTPEELACRSLGEDEQKYFKTCSEDNPMIRTQAVTGCDCICCRSHCGSS